MGLVILYVASVLVNLLWSGLVAAILWGWFIVPLGVKAITVWQAIGISTVVSAFTGVRSNGERASESAAETMARGLFMSFILPLLCLGIGWVAKENV